jgi:chromosome partitioning protein
MIIGIVNQKGGVGKTTLSTNLAAEITRGGDRVLLVDADPQGSALDWDAARQLPPLFTVSGFPRAGIQKQIPMMGEGYDHIIIDGPPRTEAIARGCIVASDVVLIPIQPSPYDIWAAEEIVDMIAEVQTYKPQLRAAFVINRRIANTALGREVVESRERYSLPVLSAMISQRVIFATAVSQGLAVYEMDNRSAGALEISAVLESLKEFCQ